MHMIINSLQKPEILSKIRNESKSKLGIKNSDKFDIDKICYENLTEMSYLTWVMNEALRIYSPIKFSIP